MNRRPGPKRRHNYTSIFRWIVAYKRGHDGNSPTMREIAAAFRIPSLSQVEYILAALAGQGLLTYTPNQARSICITGGHWHYQSPISNSLTTHPRNRP